MVIVILIISLVLLSDLLMQRSKATKKQTELTQALAAAQEQYQAAATREAQVREEVAQFSEYRVIPDTNQYAQ